MSLLPALVPAAEDKSPVWAWVRVRGLVLDSVSSPHSRRAYGRALDEFRAWCQESFAAGFTRETVQRYRAHLESRDLSPSSLNVYLSALRRLAREGAASGLLSQEQAAAVASVPGVRQKGRRLGAWLTLEQAQTLLVAPVGEGLKAVRDRALLGLLIGCGLRRDELAHITVEQIQQREGRWVLVDIDGKGRRLRSVPMPGWTKARIDQWTAASGTLSGRLIPRRHPGRGSRGGRHHPSGRVFNSQGICRTTRIPHRSPRPPPHLRPARSPRPLAPRTNPAFSRA